MDDLPPLFAPGQRLGRYELLQRLAVGGMAEVYLAFAVGPGDFRKVVAIKRLLPQHTLDPQLLRMFLDEARLMARLSHPHIPHVTDVDDGAGKDVPYFVMEYIHGTDLRGVLNAAGGPLPFQHALAITSAVAAGLHHAHEHRGGGGQRLEIVHRDVSPSNILISFDGGVKITDFGVAKWTEQKSFTHQGQLKGKFAHMSPEQCRGEALDRRSDVFALGTLLYEMTTGHPPFAAESEYELLKQIVSQDVAPPQRGGIVFPAQLSSIVMRSLRRDRDDRYPSAQELQLDLEAFAREHRMVVSPVALAGYVESLFGAQVTEWRDALASGRTLADHLGTRNMRGVPASAQAPGGGITASAPERTATDTFARLPGRASSLGQTHMAANLSIPPPAPLTADAASPAPSSSSSSSTGAMPSQQRRAWVTRTVAIAAMTAAGLVLVLVATEMTSRWQRASQARLTPPPLGTSGGFAIPTGSSFAGASPATVSSSGVGAPNHLLRPLVSAMRVAPPTARSSLPNLPSLSGVARSPLPTALSPQVVAPSTTPSSVPKGRERALRLARREPAVPHATRSNEQPAAADSARVSPVSEALAPAPGASTPLTPAAARGGGDVPPQPVKVWDPDSPVPP